MKILQRVFVVIYLILVVDAFPTAVRLRTVLQQQRPPQRLPILSSSSSSTARHLKITRVGPGGQEVPISSVPQPTEDKNPTNQSTNDTAAAASSDVVVDPSEAFASIEAGGNLVSSSSTTTDDGTATIPNLIFSLVKSIVGAGVLSLPAGIAMFGDAPSAVIPAVILIATIGVLSGYGFALIGRVCSLTGTASYRSAWEESISKESSWIPAVAVTFKAIFAILAYSMILGDTFQSIALSTGYKISKTTVLMVITTVVLLPLCLLKNLGSLAPFSLLGSLGMVYTAGAMAIRYYGKAYAAPGGVFAHDLPRAFRPSFGTHGAAYALSPKASILLGMLSTAYMAHFNAPRFYNTLQNKSVPRFLTVVGTSFGISIALFAVIAALGFLTFGGSSSGLILNNYSTRDTLMGLSRIAVAISIVFSYPLAFTGARDGILDLFKVQNRPTQLLNVLTVGMLAATTVAALTIPDVSFVLAFGGATLGNALIYIFPGLMFRGAIHKLENANKMQRVEVKIGLTSAAIGALLGIMGAAKAVQSIM